MIRLIKLNVDSRIFLNMGCPFVILSVYQQQPCQNLDKSLISLQTGSPPVKQTEPAWASAVVLRLYSVLLHLFVQILPGNIGQPGSKGDVSLGFI